MNCKNCNKNIQTWMNYCPYCGFSLKKKSSRIFWTLSQVYDDWKILHFRRIKKSTIYGLEFAWKKLEPLHEKRFMDIEINEFQKVLDKNNTSYSTQKQIKNLVSQLFNYGIRYELAKFNFANHLIIDAPKGPPKNI